MSDWTTLDRPLGASPVQGNVMVDVLYEDEAGYQRLPADQVEWARSAAPPVLWRVAPQLPSGE